MTISKILKCLLATLIIFNFQLSANATPTITDTVITAKVKTKVALDKSISVFNIGVNTKNNIVYLDGQVESDSQAEALIEIAQGTDGVKDINTDNLHVKTSQRPIVDTLMTAKVKTLFIQKKLFTNASISPADIHVETINGVVYLTGVVKNQATIDNAIKLAKSIRGVTHVESRLKLAS